MNPQRLGLDVILSVILFLRGAFAGYCTTTYACQRSCYYSTLDTTQCGLFNWWKCHLYKRRERTCYSTCYQWQCCTGYTGSSCNTPICYSGCSSDGICVAPNRCDCNSGYQLLSDGRTCIDINECATGAANCQHGCVNTRGSYMCTCDAGFQSSGTRGNICEDIDECSQMVSGCHQDCSNTLGSYICSCRTGFRLDFDGKSCSDIDECTEETSVCESLVCQNTVGSYHCYCDTGFQVNSNGSICEDIDECLSDNGGCDQNCENIAGSYICGCKEGFRIISDTRNCTDTDECAEGLSGCSQKCLNTEGSFKCTCNVGYTLEADGKTCLDIDDCQDVVCHHGGTCRDGLDSYHCICLPGYTSDQCETDVDECQVFNGGCQQNCTNTEGSFRCGCAEGQELHPNGFVCSGGEDFLDCENVFKSYLPKPCFELPVTGCSSISDFHMEFLSTSEWFQYKSSSSLFFTFGVVFINTYDLLLPVSLRGLEVTITNGKFNINYGVHYELSEGTKMPNSEACRPFELVESDIFNFVSCGAFLRTFLTSLYPLLPNWLSFDKSADSVLAIDNMKSELLFGSEISKRLWCNDAPVFPDRMYGVFQFSSSFNLSVLGQEVHIPAPLKGHAFCLIVGICQDNWQSVFLMIPDESREILNTINIFKHLKGRSGLSVLPRGLGLSVNDGINAAQHSSELTLWNGDNVFNPIPSDVNIWIGGDFETAQHLTKPEDSVTVYLEVRGGLDLYVDVPSIKNMLTSIFYDEWNMYMAGSGFLTFTVNLFGWEIVLNDLVRINLNTYLSVGGADRVLCGDRSNPEGFFFALNINANPFRGIPLIRDWLFQVNVDAFVSVTYEITQDTAVDIDIQTDIFDIESSSARLWKTFENCLQSIDSKLTHMTNGIVQQINETSGAIKTLVQRKPQNIFQEKKGWLEQIWDLFMKIEKLYTQFYRYDEVSLLLHNQFDSVAKDIKAELDILKQRISSPLDRITLTLMSPVVSLKGFGFKFKASVTVKGLKFGFFDIEMVHDTDSSMQCSRFDKIKKYAKGKAAFRYLGRVYWEERPEEGNFFIKPLLQKGYGFGIGGIIFQQGWIFHVQASANMLGMEAVGDLFIGIDGLSLYLEGHVWKIFYAQIDIFAEIGMNWQSLTFKVAGKFVANARKKRQVQTDTSSFQGSYMDGLKKAIRFVSDEAQKRLTNVQEGLTKAQKAFSDAQAWLEERKSDVRQANNAFDTAISSLESAKNELEKAKRPFEEALKVLEQAQRNIDNLCKIKDCPGICIAGITCEFRSGLFGLPFPYCTWTDCMFQIPDFLCLSANAVCAILRGLAYAALEVAKIFVRLPMLAFDIAKTALSLAQIIVDKSRIVLAVAEGILELAKVGLEFAKGVLEAAKWALEGVKIAIGAAAAVLEFVVEFGMKSIIDVRNCGFNVEISTKDLPVFGVFCEVNPFKLGWIDIGIKVNFKDIAQSIWNAARATIEKIMEIITRPMGISKRDVSFHVNAKVHSILRKIRETESWNSTDSILNETIDITRDILGFNNDTDSDYETRILIFKEKCIKVSHTMEFLQEAFNALQQVATDSFSHLEDIKKYQHDMQPLVSNNVAENLTIESAGVNRDYALKDYNLTNEDLDRVLEDYKASLTENDTFAEINNTTKLALASAEAQQRAIEAIDFRNIWLTELQNLSLEYYNTSECFGFKDCVLLATMILYDAYVGVQIPDIISITQAILDVELEFIELFQNETSKIDETTLSVERINSHVNFLAKSNPFCSVAPTFLSELKSRTVLSETDIDITCNVTGDPLPSVWWFKNNQLIDGNHTQHLLILNASKYDNGIYYCLAGNIVANISSTEANITVLDRDDDECQTNNGGCEHECENTVGSFKCHCDEGYVSSSDGMTCTESKQEQDTLNFSVHSTALIVSLSGLGLALMVVTGLLIYFKFGKQKKTKSYDLEEKNRAEPAPVEEIELGPMDPMLSEHQPLPEEKPGDTLEHEPLENDTLNS